MEIRPTLPPAPLSGAALAPTSQSPHGRPGLLAVLADETALETIEGILSAPDGSRERVTLRLLPPSAAGAAAAGLLARIEGSAGGVLRLVGAFGTIEPQRPLAAVPGSTVRIDIVARTPLPGTPAAESPEALAAELAEGLAETPEALLPPPGSERFAAALQMLLAVAPGGTARLRQSGERSPAASATGQPSYGVGIASASTAASGGVSYWQVIPLAWPFVGVERSYLLRRERARPPPDAAEGPARFMLEFSLPRLGPLQLDGLYRRGRFDLMLRSHSPLPAAIRDEAARRFHAALAGAALSGGVAFAAMARFPVSAVPEPRPLGIDV